MALNMFVKAVGQRSGQLAGSVSAPKYKGWIRAHSFSWGLDTPTDPASGLPAGRRAHRNLTIVLADAPASALLATAEATNETLTSVILAIDGPGASGTGKTVRALTIKLTNAHITSFAVTGADPDSAPHEQITIAYQKIEYTAGANTFADDWAALA